MQPVTRLDAPAAALDRIGPEGPFRIGAVAVAAGLALASTGRPVLVEAAMICGSFAVYMAVLVLGVSERRKIIAASVGLRPEVA